MTAAAPTSGGYQEEPYCRACAGWGRRVLQLSARVIGFGGMFLGYSSDRRWLYTYAKCGLCRGSGGMTGPSARDLACWMAAVGFRAPQVRVGYPVRGEALSKGEVTVEGDAISGVLGEVSASAFASTPRCSGLADLEIDLDLDDLQDLPPGW
jgi:hypothetical protein